MSNITWLFVLVSIAIIIPVVVGQIGVVYADYNGVELISGEKTLIEKNLDGFGDDVSIMKFIRNFWRITLDTFQGLWLVLTLLPVWISFIITSVYVFMIGHIVIKLLPTT